MKRRTGNPENSENYPDSFSLMEDGIDLGVQKEYLKLSETIEFDGIDYKNVLKESKKLFSEDIAIEAKKKLLILLAHCGTAESYQIIENYLRHASGEWKDWALLSLRECRAFLESDLLEVEGGFLSTGLGGKNDKLRYIFIVSSKGVLPFRETHRATLKKGFEKISQKYNAEIEEIMFENGYAMIGILIPMDVAVGEVIERGISECNKPGGFLNSHYYVTNVKEPTNEEILKYLGEIKREENG
jgi:hypothetical protein